MHVPFWNWENNIKDYSEVDKIRLKYFEWLMNHFRDSLYAIVIENNEKNEMICTQLRHEWEVSLAHWKNIRLTLGVGKEKKIRYEIQNLTKYEHV